MPHWFIAVLIAIFSGMPVYADTQRCKAISYKDFLAISTEWKGKDLVAFASWCSSCKAKIIEASKKSDQYILVAAFDDNDAADKVLNKFGVSSPCFYGDDLVEGLGVSVLPWSKKL